MSIAMTLQPAPPAYAAKILLTIGASSSSTSSWRRLPASTTRYPNGTRPPLKKPSSAFFTIERSVSLAMFRL
ncbi:MAG: hypothetical protein KJ007_03055 [Burkholderiales bacterium]|nr:hypothetical protein [Burkholderiales bacterium]